MMGMTINNDTKVVITKSQKIIYDNFMYDNNNNLEDVTSYKYVGIYLHHKLKLNYTIKKTINGRCKFLIIDLKIIVSL